MRRVRRWPALMVAFVLLVLIGAYVYATYQMIKPEDGFICEGVYVDDVEISGMSKEEATAAVADYIVKKAERLLVVDVNGKNVSTSLKTIGYMCEENDYVEQALQIGKNSNPFTNYMTIKNTKENHIVYNLNFTYSEKKLKNFLNKKCNKECEKSINAEITMKNGVLQYSNAKEGTMIDLDVTMQQVHEVLKASKKEDVISVVAQVKVQEPKVTMELASRCKDKLATYHTTFNAANVSRSKNLANAARLINGSVIYPGETFSVHDTISPLTEDNGYYAAPSYNNGKVEDSIGGGVCQVSTTLYNAVLRAELEIVERSPHSMVVSYVDPSMDAAIAGDYKDFKFRNNTEVPIYIEGGTVFGTIFFNLYGEETRAKEREVSFKSEIIEKIQPGKDKVTYDKTKPITYSKVTQEAHVGYKAVLWKIVKENGETEKTQVNASTYKAEPRYIIKGKLIPTPKPKQTQAPKATKEPSVNKREVEVTKQPQATATPLPEAQTVQ